MADTLGGTQVLSPQMRQALSNLSTKIFASGRIGYDNFSSNLPGLNTTFYVRRNHHYSAYWHNFPFQGNDVTTNLPLQMSLYFNVIFFPFWIATYCVMLEVKYSYLADTYKVVLIAILVLFTAVEVARLYLGYIGNLQEKVPELAGCLLLSFFPQLISLVFLLAAPGAILLPMEGATHTIMGLMIFLELVTGISTVSAMTKQQATKFHLQQFIDLENMNTSLIEQTHAVDVGRYTQ